MFHYRLPGFQFLNKYIIPKGDKYSLFDCIKYGKCNCMCVLYDKDTLFDDMCKIY